MCLKIGHFGRLLKVNLPQNGILKVTVAMKILNGYISLENSKFVILDILVSQSNLDFVNFLVSILYSC